MTWPSGPPLRTLGCLAQVVIVCGGAPPPDALRAGATLMAGALIGAPTLLSLSAVVAFVVFLTEWVSTNASTALLAPVFLSIATSRGLSPPLVAAAMAAWVFA